MAATGIFSMHSQAVCQVLWLTPPSGMTAEFRAVAHRSWPARLLRELLENSVPDRRGLASLCLATLIPSCGGVPAGRGGFKPVSFMADPPLRPSQEGIQHSMIG